MTPLARGYLAGGRNRQRGASVLEAHLRGGRHDRSHAVDGLAFFHEVEAIARDDAQVLGIVDEEGFLVLVAGEDEALFFDFRFELLDDDFLAFMTGDFRQERIGNRDRSGEHDQREHEAVKGMPDSRGSVSRWISGVAH